MSGWLRRHSNVLPTLSQVNAQRVLWQKRCDLLLDQVLCNHCIDDKDDAFAEGKGLGWIPIIAVNAEPSEVSLKKLSPTGNGRNP